MWVYDLETLAFLAVNDAAVRLYGYSSAEFARMTIRDIRPKDEVPRLLENIFTETDATLTSRGWKHQKKDGSIIDVEISSHTLKFAGRPARLVLVTDVTEQVRAREAMQRSEARYRSLVEGAPYGIFRATTEGMLLAVNPALVAMLGFQSRSDLLGTNFPQQVRLTTEAWQQLIEQARPTGKMQGIEVCWKRRDETPIEVRLSIRAVYDEVEKVNCSEFVAEDITQQKRLERQFLQSQKMEAVGRLAGGVAHDFNNLLGVILGYGDLLQATIPAEGEPKRYLEQINQAAKRAAALTHQLLAFSRQQILEPRILNLNGIIQELEPMLQRLIGEDVRVITSLDSDLASIKVDPGQVAQVIMNLAVNSRDAMPNGGTLTLETQNIHLDERYSGRHANVPPGDYVMLAVSDTGCGMSAETQARLFEPFFTTKEKGKGTGLGLATVYGIVQQSGAHIWVYSELNQGTTFKIYLPALDVPADVIQRRAPVGSRGGTETILIAEDETALRALARTVLEGKGYRVVEAANGEEALQLMEESKQHVDLVLTDLVMPELSGPELVCRVKELYPSVKALFISGYTDDAVLNGRVLDPQQAFLQKPFVPGELVRKVREVLDGA